MPKKTQPTAKAAAEPTAKPAKKATKKASAKAAELEVPTDAKGDVEGEVEGEGEATERAGSGRSLVIVESPAKAKTIGKYLGKAFVVRASMGHVRDLPKGKFGIDIEHDFKPEYTTIRGKGKVIDELKRLAKSASSVFLAPDMDREGEAIAWHLAESLDVPKKKLHRVAFNEITKKAIIEAFDRPGRLDMAKVDAQQARRVLDRIVGYKLSPLLWKKIAKGLSAGRVQSVAVRLIVEREQEIRSFVQAEYWKVMASFQVAGGAFEADLRRLGDERIEKNLDEKTARALVERIGKNPLELVELDVKPKTRTPTPPFTTSQLQQKAATMLRFSAKKTMRVAQQLYEGVELPTEGSIGLITYMRTDSTRVSDEAIGQVRALIESRFGKEYLPDEPKVFRAKAKGAQEAHEAIRPTDSTRVPDDLKGVLQDDQFKLYRLIWEKFVASQMKPALSDITTAVFQFPLSGAADAPSIIGAGPEARFVAQGEVQRFDGHLRVFHQERDDAEHQVLPPLEKGVRYTPEKIEASQHFTQPAPRYSEATLVKELEKSGIGRPSTYATIISTIQDRGYVRLDQRRFHATELGELVTGQLVENFADIMQTEFTSRMEGDLDRIESGELEWNHVVREFHQVFAKDLALAEENMRSIKESPELVERKCDKCGAPMAVLYNKRGKFLGCSNYPECKNTMPVDGPRPKAEVVETDQKCEKCGSAMVIRTGRRGRFLACTGFPKCRNTASVDEQGNVIRPKPTGIACDKCQSPMIIRSSRRGPFLACSAYPKCRNAKPLPDELREKPRESGEMCEQCGKPMVIKRSRWGKEFLACSGYPDCKNAKNIAAAAGAEGGDGSGGPGGAETPGSIGARPEGAEDANGDRAGAEERSESVTAQADD